jgi:hypothetical protein
MRKLSCIICDNPTCLKVCQIYLEVKGKKHFLHYCREQCKLEYYDRKETIKICSKILEL